MAGPTQLARVPAPEEIRQVARAVLERPEFAEPPAWRDTLMSLMLALKDWLDRFAACEPVRALLGEDFFQTYLRVKSVELDLFQSVVTSWERDHLLLKV